MKCLCCSAESASMLLESSEPTLQFEEKQISYWKCSACKTVRKLPSPDPEELKDYYESSWQFSEPRPKPCWDTAAVWMAKTIGSSIRNGIDVGGKSLSMFEALADAGVVVEKKSVLDAQPKAGEVIPGWLGQGFVSQHQYDLVIATHVLEHAIDPWAFLRDVRLMMFAGAWLYIEVPSLELGSSDLTACDDINPNHLWHFTLAGLSALLYNAGLTPIKLESDATVKGWNCNRVLCQARQWEVESFKDMHDGTRSIYEMATAKITDGYRVGDALYGACGSAWRLHDHDQFLRGALKGMKIYDLHKEGLFLGRFIRKPGQMAEDGIKRVWLTPRFWNSRIEITKWLKSNYPNIEVLSPYAGSVESCLG